MVVGTIATGTEVLVIGGGPGGYVAAARAAALGKDVTLVESSSLGGTCVSVGCIPSKALISSADLVQRLREAGDRGITAGDIQVDAARLQDWKNKVVKRLQQGVQFQMKSRDVNVVWGVAQFTGPQQVAVRSLDPDGPVQSFTFEHCIIATGSATVELPALPFDHQFVIDSTDALALTAIPGDLVVVGGGYIGVELGTLYRKLGANVTIVEMMDQLLPGVDPDLVQVLMRRLRKLGITVHLEARAVAATAPAGAEQPGSLRIEDKKGQSLALPADKVLVAVGRRPYTEGLDLAAAGVRTNEKGFIPVDEQCRTSVPHIFAVGDVSGNPMLAHRASKQGLVAAEAICGQAAACDWAGVPAVIFTDPEIAYVGLTEAQARERGDEVTVSKFPFTANGRALTHGHTDGLVKLVADRESGLILGVQMVGPEMTELVGEATLALEMVTTVTDLGATMHPHPTLSEGLMEAALAIAHGHSAS